MVVEVSDSGPSCGNTRDMPSGHISKKKHPRTEDGDGQNNTMLTRAKKTMKNNSDSDSADSSLSDNVWFVAFVTAVSLIQDTLYLPQIFTITNGFKKKTSKIVLTDGGEKSWEMDLRFRESSDEFYITKGWTHFCGVNGKGEGSFFDFELIRNGDVPLLRFGTRESVNDRPQRNGNISKRFVTKILTPDSLKRSRLYLSRRFLKANGMLDLMMVTLVGNDGKGTMATLNQEKSGRMSLGRGWIRTARAYGLEIGKPFVLEATWKDGTPMLILSKTDPESDGGQQEEHSAEASEEENNIEERTNSSAEASEEENNIEEMTNSSALIGDRFVTLALERKDVKDCALTLPIQFLRDNGIQEAGKITFLGKETKWWGYLLSIENGAVAVGIGWRNFCETNGVKVGDSFTLEFINKDEEQTPVLKLVC